MKKIKKIFSLMLTLVLFLQPVSRVFAGDPEYIPDKTFILGSSYIASLMGTTQKLTFKAPQKTSGNPLEYELFPSGSPSPDDIEQGKSRICYILAALSSIVEKHPEIIRDAITDNHDGTVTVKVYDMINSKPRLIRVQKTVPNLPRCCKILGKECLWIEMLLKGLIGAHLDQRACRKVFSSTSYSDIENGFTASALKMLTGKECEHYNDYALMRGGELTTYRIIKEAVTGGSGIVTCDFNHNRLSAILHGFLPLSSSDGGLVYGHIYSVVGAYEDKSKEKWIRIRNPWHGFSVAYDEKGKRYVEPDDSKSEGYFDLKLRDFHQCCGSLQVVKEKPLKTLSFTGRVKEKVYTLPTRFIFTALLYIACEYFSIKSDMFTLDTNLRLLLYPVLAIFSTLLFWE